MVGLEPTSLVNPNHAVYQLTYTQIFGVFRTSAYFHAWSLPFPQMLYRGTEPKPLLYVGCVLIPKNILMTLFYFVASVLEVTSEYSFPIIGSDLRPYDLFLLPFGLVCKIPISLITPHIYQNKTSIYILPQFFFFLNKLRQHDD